jgi:hypothetical protein
MYHSLKDLINAIKKMYEIPKEEREKVGLEAREWMQTE